MWRQLSRQERRCFEVQNAAIPAIARMRLAGCPFDPAIHRETIRRWEIEHAEDARPSSRRSPARSRPPATRSVRWLEAHLPAEEIAWMPRTEQRHGFGPLGSAEAPGASRRDSPAAARAVVGQAAAGFGHKLLEAVSPVTGRVHPDFMLGTKAGRLACSAPNFQQLPPDVRPAIMAPDGKLLVVADYSQIELRVLAELSGDDALRAEFYQGGDVHRAAAAAIAGIPPERGHRRAAPGRQSHRIRHRLRQRRAGYSGDGVG